MFSWNPDDMSEILIPMRGNETKIPVAAQVEAKDPNPHEG